jgi:hypothetical protein
VVWNYFDGSGQRRLVFESYVVVCIGTCPRCADNEKLVVK